MAEKNRAQGSLEYLIIIAVILAISAVVVYFMANSSGKTISDTNFAECKKAADQCQESRLLAPNDPCLACETACTVDGKDILDGTGYSAVSFCKQGDSESIYKRKLIECGNGIVEQGEVCDGGSVDCTSLDSNYISGTASCLSDCSGYDESNCVKASNSAPVLSDASVFPDSGNVEKSFHYSVRYTDVDGDKPAFIEVHVLDAGRDEVYRTLMECSGDVSTGEHCSAEFSPSNTGDYYYWFLAVDGQHHSVEYHCEDVPGGESNCVGPKVTS